MLKAETMIRSLKTSIKEILPSKMTQYILSKAKAYLKYRRITKFSIPVVGKYTYSVVTAVYNSAPYLDDYFRSLTNQRLSFRKHLQLILVDDGSVDGSSVIIKQWQQKFPENIIYISQENAGPGAARNTGLSFVTARWVTFIDSDDFVNKSYFSEVDLFLTKYHSDGGQNNAIKMLICNMIRYYEKENVFSDSHPLRFRFKDEKVILPCDSLNHMINLTVNNTFFDVTELAQYNGMFPDNKWPTFEDAYFIGCYVEHLKRGQIAFYRTPHYYYRIRSANNSLINISLDKKELYLDQISEGYLTLLKRSYKKHGGRVNEWIQQTIFYDLSYHFKRMLNKAPPKILTNAEVEQYFSLLRQCLSYIDSDVIMNFDYSINHFCLRLKIGVLYCFKEHCLCYSSVYIREYNASTRQLRLTYYCKTVPCEAVYIDDTCISPIAVKSTPYSFGEKLFFKQRDLWIQLSTAKEGNKISITLDDVSVKLSLFEERSFNFDILYITGRFRCK